jgi:hypothetical protein
LTFIELKGDKVVVTVCTESQKAALVNVVETTPVSAGLQDVAEVKVESDRLMVILNVVMESQALEAPPIIVSLNEMDEEYQVPRTRAESHSVMSSIAKAVGNKVVVTVCTESHKAALVNVVETTPVSAGLQDVAVAKVESDRLIVILNVVIESQPLAAPPTMVSLKDVEAKYQVPITCVESQSVISTLAELKGDKLVDTV